MSNDKFIDAAALIQKEYYIATTKFGAFASTHEGYAVILEELDELWDCIKTKGTTLDELREEAVQVAAMAIRFMIDCLEDHPDD